MSSAQERRNRQNVFTLAGALLASLGIVLAVVLLTVRPDPATRPEVDWHDVRASAPNSHYLVDPTFTSADGDWWANRAEYVSGDNPEWYIGLISPSGGFVSVEQFVGEIDPSVGETLDDVDGKHVTLDAVVWTTYDRSGMDDPGNRSLVYETTLPTGGTLIVSGTADAREIELVAAKAFASLKG